MKEIKSVNELRKLYYLTVQTTATPNKIPYKPRWLNQLYAFFFDYFWLPCHKCGTKYGGHEWLCSENGQGICPKCSLKQFNEAKTFD